MKDTISSIQRVSVVLSSATSPKQHLIVSFLNSLNNKISSILLSNKKDNNPYKWLNSNKIKPVHYVWIDERLFG